MEKTKRRMRHGKKSERRIKRRERVSNKERKMKIRTEMG